MKVVAKTGVMMPQSRNAKESQEPPKARSQGAGLSPGSRERRACRHLNSKLPASRTMKEYISVVLSLLDCTLLWQLKEMSDSLRTMLGKYVVPSYTGAPEVLGICDPWSGGRASYL